jgi:hypothetical protein
MTAPTVIPSEAMDLSNVLALPDFSCTRSRSGSATASFDRFDASAVQRFNE